MKFLTSILWSLFLTTDYLRLKLLKFWRKILRLKLWNSKFPSTDCWYPILQIKIMVLEISKVKILDVNLRKVEISNVKIFKIQISQFSIFWIKIPHVNILKRKIPKFKILTFQILTVLARSVKKIQNHNCVVLILCL